MFKLHLIQGIGNVYLNLTVYFESEASRKAYQDLPLNHPNLHLPYQATDEDDRGG